MQSKKTTNALFFLFSLATLGVVIAQTFKPGFLPFDQAFLAFANYDQNTQLLIMAVVLCVLGYLVLELLGDNPYLTKLSTKKIIWEVSLLICLVGVWAFYQLKQKEKIFTSVNQSYVETQKTAEKPNSFFVKHSQQETLQAPEQTPKKNSKQPKNYKKKIVRLAPDAKQQSFSTLVENGKYNALALKVAQAQAKELNSIDVLGRTPIGVALAKNDIQAIQILVGSDKIDFNKMTKNIPHLPSNPLGWTLSKIFGASYVHPLDMVQSKEAEQILRSAKLSDLQQAKLTDRIEEIDRQANKPSFVSRNKNTLLIGMFVGVGFMGSIIAYKKFNYLLTRKNLAIASSIYFISFGVWYLTPKIYAYRLQTLKAQAIISQLELDDHKRKFDSANIFRRVLLLFSLPKKREFVTEELTQETAS